MQPYFFPYLEHFRFIATCDRWVVFDTVRYRRRTWMSRNRIINRDTGWSYVSVSVAKRATRGSVAAAGLSGEDWRATLHDRLKVYAHEAPFYAETRALVSEVLAPDHSTLADLDAWGLRVISRHLGITTPIERLSELALDLPERAGAGEWGLLIARELGATEYRNASGGRDLFDPAHYEAAGIRLSFHEHRPVRYETGSFTPIADLSIIDPLMWCGRDAVSGWIAASTVSPCDPKARSDPLSGR